MKTSYTYNYDRDWPGPRSTEPRLWSWYVYDLRGRRCDAGHGFKTGREAAEAGSARAAYWGSQDPRVILYSLLTEEKLRAEHGEASLTIEQRQAIRVLLDREEDRSS